MHCDIRGGGFECPSVLFNLQKLLDPFKYEREEERNNTSGALLLQHVKFFGRENKQYPGCNFQVYPFFFGENEKSWNRIRLLCEFQFAWIEVLIDLRFSINYESCNGLSWTYLERQRLRYCLKHLGVMKVNCRAKTKTYLLIP